MSTISPDNESTVVRIRRARVESVDLYEIKDSELDLFEKGSPADLQLNFAIFLLSIAFTAVAALSTATYSQPGVQTTFIVMVVIGLLGGAYLLMAWWRNRRSLSDACDLIRERMKEATPQVPKAELPHERPRVEPESQEPKG